MGGIWLRRAEFAATISERAGYKSGLTLNQRQIIEHVPELEEWLAGADDEVLRIRSEEFEELFGNLLYAVGAAASPGLTIPGIALLHKYKGDPTQFAIYDDLMRLFVEWGNRQPGGPLDVVKFIALAGERLGPPGQAMAVELVSELQDAVQKWPWNAYRRIEWKDMAQLSSLFENEQLGSAHGAFLDQRFIDYLDRNFDSIDRINWRQFEGLAAEFFRRSGLEVQLGPGRNDDGVDLRVWRSDDLSEGPPVLLVQCKRQKEKVGKVVVKALWADIAHERAKSGLIVTTSALSPGARRVSTARVYPVAEANRETIRQWITAMRTPDTGVFMGE